MIDKTHNESERVVYHHWDEGISEREARRLVYHQGDEGQISGRDWKISLSSGA
jgi:hypothetical protein